MNALLRRTAALAAALVAVSAVAAMAQSPSPGASALALPDPAVMALPVATSIAAPDVGTEIVHVTAPDDQFLGVHYRPRSGGWSRRMDSQSVSQIHLGFFDPQGDAGREFLLGIRGGPMLDPHVQLGVGVDWSHITDNTATTTHQSNGPGGTTIQTQQSLSSASVNLFPIMAFAQISADDDIPVIPYFGIAGGYEVLNLSYDDYTNNSSFDATYGGWGWQLWGGAAFPLSGRVRANAEVFVNTAEPGRDVTDPDGITYRETVKANGVGLRLGLAWGF